MSRTNDNYSSPNPRHKPNLLDEVLKSSSYGPPMHPQLRTRDSMSLYLSNGLPRRFDSSSMSNDLHKEMSRNGPSKSMRSSIPISDSTGDSMRQDHRGYPLTKMRTIPISDYSTGDSMRQDHRGYPLPKMRERTSKSPDMLSRRKRLLSEDISSVPYSKKQTLAESSRVSTSKGRYEQFDQEEQPSTSDILKKEARLCSTEMKEELDAIEEGMPLNPTKLMHAHRLLAEQISQFAENSNSDWLDVKAGTPKIKLVKHILLPKPTQNFNIIGTLLGEGGSKLQKICKTYGCTIGIKGAGSHRSSDEEDRLLKSGNAVYAHFSQPLHALITIDGEPSSVYIRFGRILDLFRKIVNMKEPFERDGILFEPTRSSRHYKN